MNKPDKSIYYKLYSNVIVSYSHSNVICNRCQKNNKEFSVYLGDDKRLSTIWCICCGDCLPSVIKEANDKGQQNVINYYNRDCKRYYDECIQYVRKTKLDNLGNIIVDDSI